MKRKHAALLALALMINAVCLTVALAAEKPKTFIAHELPKISGSIVKVAPYADATGNNLVLLAETDIIETGEGKRSKELSAYRYRLDKDGTIKEVWRVRDYVRDCDLDAMTASFITDAFHITDLDNSGTVEVWMPYVLQCAGDPGPMTMKIIMYQGTLKHAVRGETRSRVEANEFAGGDYTLDEEFAVRPAQFVDFARELWAKHRDRD